MKRESRSVHHHWRIEGNITMHTRSTGALLLDTRGICTLELKDHIGMILCHAFAVPIANSGSLTRTPERHAVESCVCIMLV